MEPNLPRIDISTDSQHDLEKQPDSHTTKPDELKRSTTATSSRSVRVLTRFRTSESIPATPPPDGGARAWSTAVLTSAVIFNTWGFVNSFGLFQTYYVNTMKIGNASAVSWIGSLQVFLVFGIGAFSGRALDAGYFKLIFCTGSLLYLTGMFLLSLSTQYFQVFLAQGVAVGLGFGLVFVPSIALTSTYFSPAKRGMALAVAVAGSSTGGLIFPAIAEQMLPRVGFSWTVRTMAFVQMVLAVICGIFLKPRLAPRTSGPLLEWSAFSELPYTLYLIASYLFFWSVYIGFYFVGSFGRDVLGTSQSTSIDLLLVMNGVGLVARVLPNFVAEKWTGPLNLMIPYTMLTGLVLLCWTAVDSVTGLWIWAVIYGCTANGIHALFPVVLTSLTDDVKKLGVRSGMGFSVVGCAVLTGPPIAGALVQRMDGSYLGLQLFAGLTMAVAVFFLLAARWAKAGTALLVKTVTHIRRSLKPFEIFTFDGQF